MAARSGVAEDTPNAHLRSVIERFDAKDQKLIRAVRSAVRKRLPTANELVYDFRTFFVIAYSPSDRRIEFIVSLDVRYDGVRMYFSRGHRLPDPKGVLQGSGTQARFIRVEAASRLAHPEVEALIASAIKKAFVPLPASGRGSLMIRSAGRHAAGGSNAGEVR